MICHFLLLKAPVRISKRFKNSPASVKSKIQFTHTGKNELTRPVGSVLGFYCPPTQFSPASEIAMRCCLTAEAEFPGKCY